MLEEHNCINCPKRGDCYTEGVIEFLKDKNHNSEVNSFLDSNEEFAMEMMKHAMLESLRDSPFEAMKKLLTTGMVFGYCKGRSYIEIPKPFREAL